MKLVCYCGLIGIFLLVPGIVGAQVYKCVDERGRTQYSDKPGPGCKTSRVESRPQGKKADVASSQQSQQPQQPQQPVQAKDKLTLDQECASMRRELVRLASSQRVASVGKKGEVKYQEDPTRDRRLAQLQQEMRACP